MEPTGMVSPPADFMSAINSGMDTSPEVRNGPFDDLGRACIQLVRDWNGSQICFPLVSRITVLTCPRPPNLLGSHALEAKAPKSTTYSTTSKRAGRSSQSLSPKSMRLYRLPKRPPLFTMRRQRSLSPRCQLLL
jgi:hypothetical protein